MQILQGEYATLKMSRTHISERDEQEGYVLSCRVIPKSDLCLRLAPRPGDGNSEGAA